MGDRGKLGASAFIGISAVSGVALLYNIVVGRALGKEALGILGTLLSASVLVSSFVSFFAPAASKYASLIRGRGGDPYSISIPVSLLSLGFGNLVLLLALLARRQIASALSIGVDLVLAASVLGVLRGVFEVFRYLHLGLWEPRSYVLLILASSLAFWIPVPFAVREGAAGLLIPFFILYSTFLTLSLAMFTKKTRGTDWGVLPILRMSLYAGLGNIVSLFRYSLAPILLKAGVGAAAAGIFVASGTVVKPLKFLPFLAAQVLLPYYSLEAGRGASVAGKMKEYNEIIFPSIAAIISVFLPVSGYVTLLLFGGSFSGSYMVTVVLSLEVFFYCLNTVLLMLSVSYGREKDLALIAASSALLTIPLYPILIPRWGPLGASLSILAGTLGGHAYIVWSTGIGKTSGIRPRPYILVLLSVLLTALLLRFAVPGALAASALLGAAAFLLLGGSLRPLVRASLELLRRRRGGL